MKNTQFLAPVTLTGPRIRLEPLTLDHLPGLLTFALDPALWLYTPAQPRTKADLDAYLREAIDLQVRGLALPLATIDLASQQVIGTTRLVLMSAEHRRYEIGWTFLAPAFQRTYANTESKLLLLTHAFETLAALRVEFKTDALNEKSRTALTRLGAVQEGIFRHHMLMPTGRMRDSVYFAIIRPEWPALKSRLQAKLA